MTAAQAEAKKKNQNAAVDRTALAQAEGFSSMEELLRTMGGEHGEWSNVALADLLGVGKSTVGRWMMQYGIEPNPAGGYRSHRGISFDWAPPTTRKYGKVVDEFMHVANADHIGWSIADTAKKLRQKLDEIDKNWKDKNYATNLMHIKRRGDRLELVYEIVTGVEAA